MENPHASMKAAARSKLALDGGDPVRRTPLAPWPHYEEAEIAAACSVLRSGRVNYWTGDECRRFEEEFARYHGVDHAVALANGTLALELALRVLGIGSGDEVIVTPRSYFASASCIVLSGATPVFAEIDRNSQNVTAETLAPMIGKRTRALLVVHLAGWPCDMTAIMELARSRGLYVVEDCAQAHGAAWAGQRVGSFGDLSTFSFCQDKIMSTAGEGGMLLTNDRQLWEAAWSFKDHGKSWRAVNSPPSGPGFRWLHHSFGSNWRMTELQAAIGRLQLRRLEEWVARRRHNASRVTAALERLPGLRIPRPGPEAYHAYYKLYAFLRPEQLRPGWNRDRVLLALQAEGVPGLSGSCPEIYREKAFDSMGCPDRQIARELGEASLMFLVHPTLSDDDIDDVARATAKVLTAACVG